MSCAQRRDEQSPAPELHRARGDDRQHVQGREVARHATGDVDERRHDDRVARQLRSSGLRAEAIHADRSQKDRTAAIESFRAGRTKVLVATDVAARGLDIESVALIVNYEVPHGLDSYVHRVGRTGRNDSPGHALTLADPSDRADLMQIEKAFGLKLLSE